MATNDFEPFAVTGASPNVLDQASYLAAIATWLGNGFSAGIAQSIELNKVWRQGSIGTYLLGQLIVNILAVNASDNADLTTLYNNFLESLRRGAIRPPKVVGFSATPVFDQRDSDAFEITLTGNVTSSTLVDLIPGAILSFKIVQDAVGGRTFVWPVTAYGGTIVNPAANAVTEQLFVVTSDFTLRALAPSASGFVFSKANPGYLKFPDWLGGFTIQWSISPSWDPADNSEPSYAISWATPFANACLLAMVSPQIQNASAFTDNWYQVVGWTKNSVTVQRQRSGYNLDQFQQQTKALVIGFGY